MFCFVGVCYYCVLNTQYVYLHSHISWSIGNTTCIFARRYYISLCSVHNIRSRSNCWAGFQHVILQFTVYTYNMFIYVYIYSLRNCQSWFLFYIIIIFEVFEISSFKGLKTKELPARRAPNLSFSIVRFYSFGFPMSCFSIFLSLI